MGGFSIGVVAGWSRGLGRRYVRTGNGARLRPYGSRIGWSRERAGGLGARERSAWLAPPHDPTARKERPCQPPRSPAVRAPRSSTSPTRPRSSALVDGGSTRCTTSSSPPARPGVVRVADLDPSVVERTVGRQAPGASCGRHARRRRGLPADGSITLTAVGVGVAPAGSRVRRDRADQRRRRGLGARPGGRSRAGAGERRLTRHHRHPCVGAPRRRRAEGLPAADRRRPAGRSGRPARRGRRSDARPAGQRLRDGVYAADRRRRPDRLQRRPTGHQSAGQANAAREAIRSAPSTPWRPSSAGATIRGAAPVAGQQPRDVRVHELQQAGPRADSATDHDALRREDRDHADQPQGHVLRLELPDGVVERQGWTGRGRAAPRGPRPRRAPPGSRGGTDRRPRRGRGNGRGGCAGGRAPGAGPGRAPGVRPPARRRRCRCRWWRRRAGRRPGPHTERCSPRAEAVTSVSKATGTPSASRRAGASGVLAQPGFGGGRDVAPGRRARVPGRRAPKAPMPTAATGPGGAEEERSRADPRPPRGVVSREAVLRADVVGAGADGPDARRAARLQRAVEPRRPHRCGDPTRHGLPAPMSRGRVTRRPTSARSSVLRASSQNATSMAWRVIRSTSSSVQPSSLAHRRQLAGERDAVDARVVAAQRHRHARRDQLTQRMLQVEAPRTGPGRRWAWGRR